MSRPLLTTRQLALPLAIGLAMPMAAGAQTTGATAGTATASTTTTPQTTSSTRLAASYASWAGSTANAQSLVKGLTNGTTVTLSTSNTGTSTGTTGGSTSFSPSTGKMGVGEVGIALSLAKASLAQQGISKPTPEQISAALNGGLVTSSTGTMSVPGVLSQRSSGMGWGQIAQAMGVKLGSVVSASKTDKSKAAEAATKSAGKTKEQSAHARADMGRPSDARGAGGEGHGGGHGGGGGGGGGKK